MHLPVSYTHLDVYKRQADILLGVSAAGAFTKDILENLADDAIVFAMANPNPEATYADMKAAGIRIAGTGRSDAPNQINNVAVFLSLIHIYYSVRDVCTEYLEPLLSREIEVVVLGCTHFPFVQPLLEELTSGRIQFIDPAFETSELVRRRLELSLIHISMCIRDSYGRDQDCIYVKINR